MARQKSICEIPDCGNPVKARGLCTRHYKRLRRHGDPLGGASFRAARGEPMEFIESALAANTEDCIEWPFSRDRDGYGKLGQGRAHRKVLEMASGPAPSDEHEAAHAPAVCHNRACINPKHLRWATTAENSRDRYIDGTTCWGESGTSKLTARDVLAIRADAAAGVSIPDLARRHSVTYQNIRHILIGKTWRYLNGGLDEHKEAEVPPIR